jgi:hypothetical protein
MPVHLLRWLLGELLASSIRRDAREAQGAPFELAQGASAPTKPETLHGGLFDRASPTSAGPAALHTAVVDGDLVFRDGAPSCVDQTSVLEELREAHKRLIPELDRIDELVDQLRPVYERIHRRASSTRFHTTRLRRDFRTRRSGSYRRWLDAWVQDARRNGWRNAPNAEADD